MTKRTCDFITDARKRSSLYISLVRSQFEHCSTIWRPTTKSEISAFDNLQKKAIKWIHGEPYRHYDNETYLQKCAQMKIIPMMAFFDINDLVFFHKIVYNLVPFSFPNFIQPYTGQGRLCNLNLDYLSFINISISGSASSSIRSPSYKNVFHTVLHEWNSLLLHIHQTLKTKSRIISGVYYITIATILFNNPPPFMLEDMYSPNIMRVTTFFLKF